MKRLRIASLFTELGVGGDENRLLHFSSSLDRDRFDHFVVTLVPTDAKSEETYGPIAGRYRDLGIPLLDLGEQRRSEAMKLPRALSAGRDGVRTLRIATKLARLLEREQVDVLDARMHYNLVVGMLAARMAKTPVTLATEYFKPWWLGFPWRFVAPRIFASYDAFISDSKATLDQYRDKLDIPLANGRVVQNGVPIPRSTLDRATARRRLGLPDGVKVVAQIARLQAYKGQRILIEAAEAVLRDEPDTWFLICGYSGPGGAGPQLKQEVARRGLSHRVIVTEYPGPIADVWQAVDIHAHPSLLDSSPIAIHESMALAIPAVVSSTGGIPELIVPEETALMVPPGDADALARALIRLLRDPALGVRLAKAAQVRYHQRHRPELMARAIEALILEALERNGKGRA